MSGQTIYFFLIFAPSFAHIGIPVGCFLLIVLAVLALVGLYQRFAFRRGIQTRLMQISRKLEEISDSDVEMISITKHTESLEDYFLKLTEEVEKSCEN